MISIVLKATCDICRKSKSVALDSLSASMREGFEKLLTGQGWAFFTRKCYCPKCVSSEGKE